MEAIGSKSILINAPRHSLIQIRFVFVVVLACFTLMRSVIANIDVRFDSNDVVAYRSFHTELKCTATSSTGRRPLVYWDRINKVSKKCVSLLDGQCSHISPSSVTGATKWKVINCGATNTPACGSTASRFEITTKNEGTNTRKTTLGIDPNLDDGKWKYACKAWIANPAEYGEANATLTVRNGIPPSSTKPVHSSSSSNSSSNTTSPASPPGGGSGGVRAAGADNGVVVAIASAVIVAIINVV